MSNKYYLIAYKPGIGLYLGKKITRRNDGKNIFCSGAPNAFGGSRDGFGANIEEKPHETVNREVKEETGFTISLTNEFTSTDIGKNIILQGKMKAKDSFIFFHSDKFAINAGLRFNKIENGLKYAFLRKGNDKQEMQGIYLIPDSVLRELYFHILNCSNKSIIKFKIFANAIVKIFALEKQME